ncbi:MAG TPA: GNAT family N-acetyltransferase [Candidatus Acidoferrales bacterium]
MAILTTERLILRRWRDSDREPFARMCADLRVMEFMPRLLTREESFDFVARIEEHIRAHGFGLYAAELRAEPGSFIGFVGIWRPAFVAAFTPCVEIGWRLAPEYWGRGLATEGARAVAAHAFGDLKLPEIVSFTAPANVRSRRVMEKIGMARDMDGDFDHPRVAEGNPLRRHVLYRMKAPK